MLVNCQDSPMTMSHSNFVGKSMSIENRVHAILAANWLRQPMYDCRGGGSGAVRTVFFRIVPFLWTCFFNYTMRCTYVLHGNNNIIIMSQPSISLHRIK